MKKRILFVGESPYGNTGNSHMMNAIIKQVDQSKYEVACLTAFDIIPDIYPQDNTITFFSAQNWNTNKLIEVLSKFDFNYVFFVGIDVWRYQEVYPYIKKIQEIKKFILIGLFPYDLHVLRFDWITWFNFFDVPMIYSEYGYTMLKSWVNNVRYYRPPMSNHSEYYITENRKEVRKSLFSSLREDQKVIGFVGVNSIRKNVPLLMKAVSEVKKVQGFEETILYLHTEINEEGVYDIPQFAFDLNYNTGALLMKSRGKEYTTEQMRNVYNSLDFFVMPSMQEGLSWCPIEAMLCGVPTIVTDSTAHKDLPNELVNKVSCDQFSLVPMKAGRGNHWIESRTPSLNNLVDVIVDSLTQEEWKREEARTWAKDWCDNADDINKLLEDISPKVNVKLKKKKKEILFAQHSSAGDVLMTTACFKGIKERHKNNTLVYMTQKKFMNIIEGNPYVDKIIEWDEKEANNYDVVYNPHGEKILPGGWNNLDTPLYSMYPYFTKVKADKITICQKKPKAKLPDEYIVVHTAGANKKYRTYNHMDIAINKIPIPVVQIGSLDDKVCHNADFDLRGRLSFQESAWVVAHSRLCICVDSFVSHLSGAVGTPVVVLYGPAPARVVGPCGDKDKIVNIEPDHLDVCKIMSHCWGAPRKEQLCQTPCINTISPNRIKKAIKSFIG